MQKFYIIILLVLTAVTSCEKDKSDDTLRNAKARDALYSLMDEWYLWYDEMPSVTLSNYKDPYELLEAVRYLPLDRWSFVADYAEFMASLEGTFVGHGIQVSLDESDNVRIIQVYKNSPLYPEGVRRGWILKKVNNTDLAPIMIAGDWQAYSQLFGPSTTGWTNTFLFQKPDGSQVSLTSAKATFQVNSVTDYEVLNLASGKTGYLVFDEFIEPSPQELETAFSYFSSQGVKDLILDLRYNSGGLVDVAIDLASYVSGLSSSTVMAALKYNDKKQDQNDTLYFKNVQYPLNLSRMVVITSRLTASASEVVINCLRPFLDVTCIGDTTHGKPTGMNFWVYPNINYKFVFAPVTFSLVNSQDYGDFYDGFPPAKYVPDDLSRDWGDPEELCLKEAIYFIENNSTSSKGSYIFTRPEVWREKEKLTGNSYIKGTEASDIK